MQIKTNFRKLVVYRLKIVCTYYVPTRDVYIKYIWIRVSLRCGKFRKHDCEPLFGHGNTFDTGLPVRNTSTKRQYGEIKKTELVDELQPSCG
jgi:hypothetical protein